jgi:hypothetical protein
METEYKSGLVENFSFINGELRFKINDDNFFHKGYDLESNVIFSLSFAVNQQQEVVYSVNKKGEIKEVYSPIGLPINN